MFQVTNTSCAKWCPIVVAKTNGRVTVDELRLPRSSGALNVYPKHTQRIFPMWMTQELASRYESRGYAAVLDKCRPKARATGSNQVSGDDLKTRCRRIGRGSFPFTGPQYLSTESAQTTSPGQRHTHFSGTDPRVGIDVFQLPRSQRALNVQLRNAQTSFPAWFPKEPTSRYVSRGHAAFMDKCRPKFRATVSNKVSGDELKARCTNIGRGSFPFAGPQYLSTLPRSQRALNVHLRQVQTPFPAWFPKEPASRYVSRGHAAFVNKCRSKPRATGSNRVSGDELKTRCRGIGRGSFPFTGPQYLSTVSAKTAFPGQNPTGLSGMAARGGIDVFQLPRSQRALNVHLRQAQTSFPAWFPKEPASRYVSRGHAAFMDKCRPKFRAIMSNKVSGDELKTQCRDIGCGSFPFTGPQYLSTVSAKTAFPGQNPTDLSGMAARGGIDVFQLLRSQRALNVHLRQAQTSFLAWFPKEPASRYVSREHAAFMDKCCPKFRAIMSNKVSGDELKTQCRDIGRGSFPFADPQYQSTLPRSQRALNVHLRQAQTLFPAWFPKEPASRYVSRGHAAFLDKCRPKSHATWSDGLSRDERKMRCRGIGRGSFPFAGPQYLATVIAKTAGSGQRPTDFSKTVASVGIGGLRLPRSSGALNVYFRHNQISFPARSTQKPASRYESRGHAAFLDKCRPKDRATGSNRVFRDERKMRCRGIGRGSFPFAAPRFTYLSSNGDPNVIRRPSTYGNVCKDVWAELRKLARSNKRMCTTNVLMYSTAEYDTKPVVRPIHQWLCWRIRHTGV